MTNITTIHGADYPTGEVCHAAVDILRQALDMAERGQITKVAIASVMADNAIWLNWGHDEKNTYALVGAIAMLQHEIALVILSSG